MKGLSYTGYFPVHWPDGNAKLMSPNKGETTVHGCHCPGDMVVRMRKVLAVPWWLTVAVGTCASVHLLGIVITLLPTFKTVSSVDDAIEKNPQARFRTCICGYEKG